MRRITKKQILNEIMGVPKVIDTWVFIFTEQILEGVKELIQKDEWEEVEGGDDEGNKLEILMNSLVIEDTNTITKYFNVSNENDLLENEDYMGLPIWRPLINVDVKVINGFPYWKFKDIYDSSFNGGMGFIEDGNSSEGKLAVMGDKDVIPNLYLTIEVIMDVNNMEDLDTLKNSIKSTVSHELTHVYQSYMGLLHGVTGYGDEEVLNTMVNTLKDSGLPQDLKNFFHLIYAHLSFENNARVAQTYHELKNKGVDNKKDFLYYLKKTNMWAEYTSLRDFNTEDFIKNVDFTPQPTGNPIFDMMGQFRNMMDDNNSDKLKKLTQDWNELLKVVIKHYKMEFNRDISMGDVPKKALEDPYHFFKFWEKRFHKNAEDYRRKLMRIASLLVKIK